MATGACGKAAYHIAAIGTAANYNIQAPAVYQAPDMITHI